MRSAAIVLAAAFGVACGRVPSMGARSLREFRGHGPRLPEDADKPRLLAEPRRHEGGLLIDVYGDSYYADALIDHNSPSTGTWSQRYFVNDTVWGGPGSPIFLYIGGEGPLSSGAVSPFTFMSNLAEEHGALMVALEHRFYGRSYPTADMSTPNLAFLSHDQALADIYRFRQWFHGQRSAGGSKWVAFGGSYPGCLSAWTRRSFPTSFVGSVASSAPVRAVENMWQYMDVVGSSLEYFGGRQCVDAVANASYAIHALGATAAGRAQLSQHFNTCAPIASDDDLSVFESEVMGTLQGLVQYNEFLRGRSANSPVALACSAITGAPSPIEGMIQVVVGKGGQCVDAAYSDSVAELSKTAFDGRSSSRQWFWQTCRTFGFYQTTDYENQPFYWFRGVDLDSYLKVCRQVFGVDGPNTTVVNDEFKADHPDGSNIVFVNGNVDPWHSLSVFTNSSIIAHPTETSVFINGTAHCGDMYRDHGDDDIPSLVEAHAVIAAHVRSWLA